MVPDASLLGAQYIRTGLASLSSQTSFKKKEMATIRNERSRVINKKVGITSNLFRNRPSINKFKSNAIISNVIPLFEMFLTLWVFVYPGNIRKLTVSEISDSQMSQLSCQCQQNYKNDLMKKQLSKTRSYLGNRCHYALEVPKTAISRF